MSVGPSGPAEQHEDLSLDRAFDVLDIGRVGFGFGKHLIWCDMHVMNVDAVLLHLTDDRGLGSVPALPAGTLEA